MMHFSNVLRLVLSVGAKRRRRIDMSSVEWFGKLKCLNLITGSGRNIVFKKPLLNVRLILFLNVIIKVYIVQHAYNKIVL